MKKCYKCVETKDLSEFHKNKRQKDGYQNYCKGCAKVRNRDYYLSTPEKNTQRQAFRVAVKLAAQQFVWDYLTEHPCVGCPEVDPVVLEFDHVRGVKKFSISAGVSQGLSVKTISEEIEKCEVKCANCHRRKTAITLGWYRSFMGP